MKKITVLFTIFILLTSIICVQFTFAKTNIIGKASVNESEKMYIYERNLITKETTRREIGSYDNLNRTLSNINNVSMEPYIPEGMEEVNNNGASSRAIVGTDNRTLADTSQFPFSCIGYLSINN